MAGKQHVFIVGSKGIPASYGGFETFVEKLTQYKKSPPDSVPCGGAIRPHRGIHAQRGAMLLREGAGHRQREGRVL